MPILFFSRTDIFSSPLIQKIRGGIIQLKFSECFTTDSDIFEKLGLKC